MIRRLALLCCSASFSCALLGACGAAVAAGAEDLCSSAGGHYCLATASQARAGIPGGAEVSDAGKGLCDVETRNPCLATRRAGEFVDDDIDDGGEVSLFSLRSKMLARQGSLPPTATRRGGVVLHMHFNEAFKENVDFFLHQTELCKPWNFVACAFVGPWTTGSEDMVTTDARGMMGEVVSSGSSVAVVFSSCADMDWRFMYKCLADAPYLATLESQGIEVQGVLFLADDVVVTRVWPDVRGELQSQHSLVMPGLWRGSVVVDLRKEGCGEALRRPAWGILQEQGTGGCEGLLAALDSLDAGRRARLGVDGQSAPVRKAIEDVAYLPRSQVREFRELAGKFYAHRVHTEWALPSIAVALGGKEAILSNPEHLRLHELWDDGAGPGRKDYGKVVAEEQRRAKNHQHSNFAFLHPVKLKRTTDPQACQLVTELYRQVFAPQLSGGRSSSSAAKALVLTEKIVVALLRRGPLPEAAHAGDAEQNRGGGAAAAKVVAPWRGSRATPLPTPTPSPLRPPPLPTPTPSSLHPPPLHQAFSTATGSKSREVSSLKENQ